MQGVTILHEYQYIIDYLWGWRWYGIALMCIGVLLLVLAFYLDAKHEEMLSTTCVVLFCLAIAFGILSQLSATKVYEDRQKVLLDETCNITEFFDKYEVVDKEGEIYIVKPLTNNKNVL